MRTKTLRGKGDPSFPYHIPIDRVAKVIEDYIEKNIPRSDYLVPDHHRHGIDEICNLTGFLPRRIYSILEREYQSVNFETVDKLFIGLQCLELWHIAPESGGFADLYECETVQPELPPATEKQLERRNRLNAKRRAEAQQQSVAA